MRALLAGVLALALSGCSWLAAQDFDVCMEYKGRHVCAGRHGGVWTVTAGDGGKLSPDDVETIKKELGR